VELDREVALRTQADTNCPVMTPEEALATGRSYDAIHMGDVVEHLTEPESQMRLIRSLLTANGTLLAQGPLEGNASLLPWVLKIWRRLSKPGPTDYAPFHVVLATANGQLRIFERYGFRTLEYRLVEVDWPAPSKLAQKGMTLRGALLFFLRQVSKLVSTCNPGRWGNRYYYVGAKVGERD